MLTSRSDQPITASTKTLFFRVGGAVVPAGIALLAVSLEPAITHLAMARQATLPLVVILLLASLLHPRLRTGLIITLCYGVSFLAFRDMLHVRQQYLPAFLDYDFIDTVRTIALLTVSLLAGTAAIAESIQPGTVWACRCYFGASMLYFTGVGLLSFGHRGSLSAFIMIITGLMAGYGFLFAHKLAPIEVLASEEQQGLADEAQLTEQREESRRIRLIEKEWRDNLPASETETDPKLNHPSACSL